MNIFQKVTLKTLKENRTRTIVSIIGIILSLSMFTAVTTSVSSFRNYMLEITKTREGNWHGAVSVNASDKDALSSESAIESISFLEHIGYVRLTECTNPDKPYLFIGGMDKNAAGTLPLIITEGRMPENENEILIPSHLASSEESAASSQQKQQQVLLDVQIHFINDDTYKAYLKEQGLPADLFMNPQHPIAVAYDFFRYYNSDTGKYHTMHVLNSDSVSVTLIQRLTPEGYAYTGYYVDENGDFVYSFDDISTGEAIEVPASGCTANAPATIGSIRDDVPFFLGADYGNGLTLFYPASVMETVLGSDEAVSVREGYADFYFAADDHKSATADISETLKNMGLNGNSVYDYAANAAQERTLLMIITVFSYGFITLISLIAVANVFNTISTNIQLRKREFAMLKSTGMTPMGFRIMMCYECLLYGIKSLIYGLPVSIAVTYWIYRGISSGWEASFYIPWYSLITSIGSVFLVVGGTMIYSMHKISRENIMDNLKNDTV